mmetsp:Transcript_19621/g.47545  ORF Transcript_19621/g.47545 Transcript_19621/m.47545 type:complete len:204 (-) Transcript_19621:1130-1741(-)
MLFLFPLLLPQHPSISPQHHDGPLRIHAGDLWQDGCVAYREVVDAIDSKIVVNNSTHWCRTRKVPEATAMRLDICLETAPTHIDRKRWEYCKSSGPPQLYLLQIFLGARLPDPTANVALCFVIIRCREQVRNGLQAPSEERGQLRLHTSPLVESVRSQLPYHIQLLLHQIRQRRFFQGTTLVRWGVAQKLPHGRRVGGVIRLN